MAARQILDPETHERVIEIHNTLGEKEARRFLGNLSPEAYARAYARLTQQWATVELIRARAATWKGGAR